MSITKPTNKLSAEEKRARLAQLLKQPSAQKSFPLSFAQQRLWILDQIEPTSAAYTIPAALRLHGPLDLPALRHSLNSIVARHETLRTTFPSIAGQPIQRVAPPAPVALLLLDLQSLTARARDEFSQSFAAAAVQQPFDLARGPLLRVALLRLASNDHVLLLTMHHIIADGWSLGILIRELVALYTAALNGQTPALPPLPIQYADFAIWQRQWLQGTAGADQPSPLQSQLAYWSTQLAGLPALDLPTDYARPPRLGSRGADVRLTLPASLVAQLHALSRRADATLFMTLLAACQVLLARYSDQDDFALGTPIAGRTRRATEELIGCFVNTLVLRAPLAGDPPFDTFLRRVRTVCLDAYAHQDLPFEQLVEALQPQRDLSRPPLVQAMFALQNAPIGALTLPELQLQLVDLPHTTSQFDLSLTFDETASGLVGTIEYSTELFEAATIERMPRQFATLLAGIVAQPDQRLAALPLLTAAEQQQLLTMADTPSASPKPRRVDQLIADQAARTPDAIALVQTAQHLSYAELDRCANQLAHYLQVRGVGPEVRVGLCLDRSLALMIGLLGVLKAGAAYVPLDPNYPPARLAFMIEDSQIAVLITGDGDTALTPAAAAAPPLPRTGDKRSAEGGLAGGEGSQVSRSIVNLHASWPAIAQAPSTPPARAAWLDSPAYVIYTSGSLGTPKGVLITHRALGHYAQATCDQYQLTPHDRVLQFGSISFDGSADEIFPCLVAGATLVLRDEALPTPAAFWHNCALRRLTVLLPPTAYWHELVAALPTDVQRLPPTLRFVAIGGERALPERVQLWQQHGGAAVQLQNAYGPTEVTICATAYVVPPDAPPGREVPIGRALRALQAYVLDRRMALVPIGLPGELYLGGVQLARGYLARPDLTAERFVPNPFAEVSGIGYRVLGAEPSDTRYPTPDTRLYKTGDRVRWRADGQLEFLGRIDQQVKLRGFRIELGEIEALLGQHPAVHACVVLVRDEGPGAARLVAYVVPIEDERRKTNEIVSVETQYIASVRGPSSITQELRDHLKQRLPDYMLPAAFVLLDALPHTPSGKLDRRALPALTDMPPDATHIAPRTPIEEVLADLWREVLSVAQIGVHDNFFALGGHSLLATRIIARMREIFQVDLPLRTLFEAPTVAGLAEQIVAARRGALGLLPPPLVPAPRDGLLPLAFAQQRLWFLDQLEPLNPAYNIPVALRLAGKLDTSALRRSLRKIVRRHEILRTTFALVAGQPVQVIAPLANQTHAAARLPLLDLRALPAHTRESAALRLAAVEAARPFDLARGPLLRATLLRLDEQDYLLLLTTHHIIFDGSADVFFNELAQLYESYAAGRPTALPPLPIQYADYALWQREWLRDEVLDAQLGYWRTRLAGELPLLDLPTDRPRPAIRSFQGAEQAFRLPKLPSAGLLALSRREGVTLFMTLLAAWQALLARHSGQKDIAVGSPITNRPAVETEALIGCFVNTLVLRTNLAGNPPFTELLVRVRETALGAYAHQDLPFERLVEALQPERDLSRNPLFQVMFVLQHTAPGPIAALPGLRVQMLETAGRTARFDMLLSLWDGPDGLAGSIEYNTDAFDVTTITRLLRQFQVLLTGIVAEPAQHLADLPILTRAERQQLVEWNATATADAPQVCIQQLFEAQAARTPDAVAVVFDFRDKETRRQGDKETTDRTTNDGSAFSLQPSAFSLHVTYAELNRRANQLAQHLRAIGVEPGALVAIYLERSPAMIPALLGVLKAGAAYVPLETSFPPARIQWILSSLAIHCMITEAPQLPTIRELQPELSALQHVICMDAMTPPTTIEAPGVQPKLWTWSAIDQLSAMPQATSTHPDDLAYIIFTSGSTGTPKGVMVRHRPVVNLIDWVNRTFALTPADQVLFVTSLCFDLSVYDVFGLLAAGGSIRIASDRDVRDPERLLRMLRDEPISFWDSAPAALQQLVPFFPAVRATGRTHLRLVFLSGDWIPVALPAQVGATFAQARVISLGGATEATIWSNYYPIDAVNPQWSSIPYGRPIQNAQYYILDEHMRPCPIGVPGDLYIGGLCLAEGYAAEPSLTADRFVPNPFARTNAVETQNIASLPHYYSSRLYRTGDRARYWPDGVIEFLGRLDQQVKIRGFRIELGEIEAVLAQHPGVREAALLARADVPGDKRLVAYVVPQDADKETRGQGDKETDDQRRGTIYCALTNDEGPNSSIRVPSGRRASSVVTELRAFLKERLPEYMLPAAFIFLDALPLTANGKLDRRALPPPEQAQPDQDDAFVAPRTPVEEVIASSWAEVLRIERIGVYDSFFELGGHSLLATQVIARMQEIFQINLPLRSLFEAPTVAGLAEQIAEAQRDRSDTLAPPLRPLPRDGLLPLAFAQQRLWFLHQLEPDSAAYNVPAAVRLSGPLDLPALQRSLNSIVARHETLRTTFALTSGQPHQLIRPARTLALPLLDVLALPVPERDTLALDLAGIEASRPFNLARGPLLRVHLLRLRADEHIVLLTLHHIVADAWSIGVLIRELATLYTAAISGRPAQLPPLPIQYADYAAWQRAWLQGEGDHTGSPLQTQLAYWKRQLADLPTLQLPTDHPRPPASSFRGATYNFELPQALSAELTALSRRTSVTLFMTLLAAFQVLLARYSGQHDIVVGTTIANRTRAETEPLIGCFINTLVLRSSLAANPSFQELLAHVREVALQAYAHQDLPFESLVEHVQPERDLSRQPLFQVLFELQNAPVADLALADLRARPLAVEHGAAKFDLSLSLTETDAGLSGVLVYATDLFVATTIERMAGHFQTLLAGVVADPAQRIATLPLLTNAEWHELVVARNASAQPYPRDAAYPQLFAAQVARSPDAIAAVCDNTHLSYQALAQRAELLARFLQQRGIARGDRVGICLDRSFEMLVGLLGIFQTGAAFVPIDPAFPPERRDFILQDAQVKLLLTSPDKETSRQGVKGRDDLPISVSPGLRVWSAVVDLQTEWETIARVAASAPPCRVALGGSDLAYLIYTSGSTGTPKGVLIPHSGLLNYLIWCLDAYTVREGRGAPVHASIAADAIFPSLFAPLLVGTSVVVIPEPQPLDTLAALLDSVGHFSTIKITPSQLEVLNQLLPASAARAAVRTLVVGAEAVHGEVLQFWQSNAPETIILDEYGPTETVVGCSSYRVSRPIAGAVPIGLPSANMQFYVLDRHMQVVPLGVVGELYIGGDGVAWGYQGRPALTAERFVPNPFADQRQGDKETRRQGDKEPGDATEPQSAICNLQSAIGTRLYRTGDLVRYLDERAANIVFLGRADDQVKLRGYRVEPGEVAAVLGSHPAVREAVVLAREDGFGDRQLVAYVVTTNDERRMTNEFVSVETQYSASVRRPSSIVSELRAFLAERLPAYMVPSAFVLLDAMPLAPHGKVDRKALPAPERSRPASDATFAAPRTPIAEVIANIWAEVLGLDQVGENDNFFVLGGHSLLATQVMSRVQAAFQVSLSLRSLFAAPTVAGLAEQIMLARHDTPDMIPPLQPVPRGGALPLSFAQQRLWFLDQLQPDSSVYNVPAAVRLSGALDLVALQRSLDAITARHETLRTTFALADRQPVQVIAPAGAAGAVAPRLLLYDLRSLPAPEREAAALELAGSAARRPFDLARGPLLRMLVIAMAEQQHIALLTAHHIVADGWSMNVFLQELATCYDAFASGQEQLAALPALPVQYADFAVWQRAWLQGAALEAQLAYWQRQLADLPTLALPTDRPRPAVPSLVGADQPFALGPALSAELTALSRRAGATLFMTLLAAWQLLLAHLSGQHDIVVGTDIANRTHVATEPLIGFFVNQLVLRTNLAGDPTFRELLERVRSVTLDAYAHQDLPFEQLVAEIQPERDLSRIPLFQVALILQNAPAQTIALPNLTMSPLEIDRGSVQFDLVLLLEESAQGLAGTLAYSTDLFDADTISRLLAHFELLLGTIIAQPDAKLHVFMEALMQAEQQQQATKEVDFRENRLRKLKAARRKVAPELKS